MPLSGVLADKLMEGLVSRTRIGELRKSPLPLRGTRLSGEPKIPGVVIPIRELRGKRSLSRSELWDRYPPVVLRLLFVVKIK
jgi:hypothetical protein